MPDLSMVLASLGDHGAKVFQATVDAVGEGVVTIRANGGTFTDVPYMQSGFYPASGPSIGDPCYVIGQENWGLLCLGKPAAGPERSPGGGGEYLWDPSAIGISYNAGGWTIPTTDAMRIEPGDSSGSAAVYFYDLDDIVWSGNAVASASFYLKMSAVDTYGMGVDHAYVTLGLHTSAGPTGTLTQMVNLSASYRQGAYDHEGYVSIPLDWAGQLLGEGAKGIYVRTEDYPMTISGPGTLRLTDL